MRPLARVARGRDAIYGRALTPAAPGISALVTTYTVPLRPTVADVTMKRPVAIWLQLQVAGSQAFTDPADALAVLHGQPARLVELHDVEGAVRAEGEVDDRREAVGHDLACRAAAADGVAGPRLILQTRDSPVGAGNPLSSPT